jgi:hypothetical protein
MARRQDLFADVLKFACSVRLRASVYRAALAFAACHLIAVLTDAQGDILQQLVHFAAVLCRFALPLVFLGAGFQGSAKPKQVRSLHSPPH